MPFEDYFMPRIPTNRQNTSKRRFTDEDLQRPSLSALRELDNSANEQETYRLLNAQPDEPSVEELLAGAKDTLAFSNLLGGRTIDPINAAVADAPAAAAQKRAEFRSGPVGGSLQALKDSLQNPAITAALTAGSFVPHPLVQGASRTIQGIQGAGQMLDPESSLLERGFGALAAAPAISSLRNLAKGSPQVLTPDAVLPPRRPAGLLNAGGDVVEGEVVGRSGPIQRSLTAGDQRLLTAGNNVDEILEGEIIGAPQLTGRMGQGTFPVTPERKLLTSGSILTPTPRTPAQWSGAEELAEQTGRGFDPGAAIRGRRRSPMSDYESVRENATQRGVGSMEGLRDAVSSGDVDLTQALDDIAEVSLTPEQIASARAAERFGRNFRSEGGAPARSMPSMEALRSETLSPMRMSAEDALLAGDEPSMRSVLFGGPQDASGFVRPSARSPISKGRLSRSRKK